MKKTIFAVLLAASLMPAAAMAQVIVHIGPPAPVYERPVPPPERGVVWIPGYQNWNGRGYVWVPGHYEHPPRPHARWVPHRWVHRHGEWVMMEGHWR